MNRRQAKKAYKKKHGHNPPKTEVKFYPGYWRRVVMDTTEKAIHLSVKIWQEWIYDVVKIAKETIEHIKAMPDEEFNRLMEAPDLEEGAKEMARKIRSNE